MNMSSQLDSQDWVKICKLDDITPNTGVAALVQGQQMAIFRVGDERRVYALSNFDPFSQANVMSRGILGDVQGERVVASPIYKQHFSLATGRCLEEQSQKLSVFPSKIENGEIWISPVAQKTYLPNNGQTIQRQKLILIGNGLAGMRCIEDLLELASDRYEISVIGAEPWGNYNRILLSPVLSGEKSVDEIMLHPHEWYQEKSIHFISNDPAKKIDRSKKRVETLNGQILEYDRLIIATGSLPFIPTIQGTDLEGVVSFRDLFDVEKMLAATRTKQHAVVIGGGLLGLEAAYGLKQRGMQVSVVHLADRLMNRQLDFKASQLLEEHLKALDINIYTDAATEELLGKDGQVNQVKLKDGQILTADLVVFATGIYPNTQLAKEAGLKCEKGICVNDCMQTFDPSIYAVGECTEYRGQTFGLVEPLYAQAFVCATHLAEHGRLSFKIPAVPVKLKVSGCDVFSAGVIEPEGQYEDIIYDNPKAGIYKRIILQNEQIIGAVLFGDIEDGAWYAELIENKQSVSELKSDLLYGREFYLNKAS
ncbi:nitrate reductase (plasmid) [Acinetobacter sp. NCu2D-2]|uniref:nitrite reductase small subunit NirD n=1 Tax=Acinetobacter sp. NCu2D-2 TaxID=1608473 RepID=UPI0007CDE763|nr:nitrite reductase small subunit NirD [Acinetobacter sp. NCu2D-2]ANF83429.1 nitrate reductase [Acinetobacter sp. NCu2D-2]